MTTTICISELNDAACTLATSGFAPPLLASTRTSLLACSLNFGQVGLGQNTCPHPLGNNNEFHALTLNPNASGLARRDLMHSFNLGRILLHVRVGQKEKKCGLKYVKFEYTSLDFTYQR
jgi:hypothetical protein